MCCMDSGAVVDFSIPQSSRMQGLSLPAVGSVWTLARVWLDFFFLSPRSTRRLVFVLAFRPVLFFLFLNFFTFFSLMFFLFLFLFLYSKPFVGFEHFSILITI